MSIFGYYYNITPTSDVEFTEMDTISFEQSNGVTSSYKPYRVGPFAKTGSAKYRVK